MDKGVNALLYMQCVVAVDRLPGAGALTSRVDTGNLQCIVAVDRLPENIPFAAGHGHVRVVRGETESSALNSRPCNTRLPAEVLTLYNIAARSVARRQSNIAACYCCTVTLSQLLCLFFPQLDTGAFASCLDKGTLDAVLCSQSGQHDAQHYLEEVWRWVLNIITI